MDKSVPHVTVWHHLAEPLDAKDRFVHPYLTLMSDSYRISHVENSDHPVVLADRHGKKG